MTRMKYLVAAATLSTVLQLLLGSRVDLRRRIIRIDRFMRLNPTHPNIDYVLYMRGLTDMALDDSALQGFFGVDRSDRDSCDTVD